MHSFLWRVRSSLSPSRPVAAEVPRANPSPPRPSHLSPRHKSLPPRRRPQPLVFRARWVRQTCWPWGRRSWRNWSWAPRFGGDRLPLLKKGLGLFPVPGRSSLQQGLGVFVACPRILYTVFGILARVDCVFEMGRTLVKVAQRPVKRPKHPVDHGGYNSGDILH